FRKGETDNLAGLIWAGIGTVILLIYWISRENFWKIKLSNDTYLYVHKNVPNEQTTDAFVNDLMRSRNEYLKENYTNIDENLSYETQLNSLKWLKSIEVLTKSEFDQKYEELKRTVKPDKTNIGFGN
ncbi:MAG: hypothetical protein AAF466_14360, partial [Bacteroidota bacterium]